MPVQPTTIQRHTATDHRMQRTDVCPSLWMMIFICILLMTSFSPCNYVTNRMRGSLQTPPPNPSSMVPVNRLGLVGLTPCSIPLPSPALSNEINGSIHRRQIKKLNRANLPEYPSQFIPAHHETGMEISGTREYKQWVDGGTADGSGRRGRKRH